MNTNSEKINKAYSSEPWWYDARGFLILTFSYRSTLPSQIRHFGNNISNNHLEVAIGSGTLFDLILKWRHWNNKTEDQIIAFDYAERMLTGAKVRFSKMKNISLLKADAANMPWDSDAFDSINVANSIHSFPDIESSLKEIHRVLKPNGNFAGNCLLYPKKGGISYWIANRINNWGMRKGILHRPYYKEEIENFLLAAGFKIIYQQITGNCYDFVATKTV